MADGEVIAYIRTQRLLVNPANGRVTIAIAGAVGPAGPAGSGVPSGGTEDQLLAKASNVDGDVVWVQFPVVDGDGNPVKITVSDTEPTSPSIGDVWI